MLYDSIGQKDSARLSSCLRRLLRDESFVFFVDCLGKSLRAVDASMRHISDDVRLRQAQGYSRAVSELIEDVNNSLLHENHVSIPSDG